MRRSNPYRISCSKPNRAALDYSVENSVERAKPFRSKCTSIECACGARSSSREREEDGRGEKDSRREVCGSVARTHRRNRSPSLFPSLSPSVDAVDRPAWYSVLVPRHNWPPTGDAPPGIAKTRNYSLINCQRSMWPHA